MGATWSSTTEAFETQCSNADVQLKIQTKLEQLPEYNGYAVTVLSTRTPSDIQNTCDVEYNYKNTATNYVQRDTRRVTFTAAGDVNMVGTTRSGLSYNIPRITKQVVYDYYKSLASYNQTWNLGKWRTEFEAKRTYDPPLPPWSDPIYVRNIGIYNDNLKRVLASGGAFDLSKFTGTLTDVQKTEYQTNFQTYVAPTPGAPSPPNLSDVLIDDTETTVYGPIKSPSFADIIGGGDQSTQDNNALKNASGQTKNLQTYETMIDGHIDRNGPDYDPPREGDSYETLLMKFNKAYDIVAGKRTGSMDMKSSSENRTTWYKRFIGRGFPFPIPEPIIPLTTPPKGALAYNYEAYDFTAKQNELIHYCPVDGDDLTRLKQNYCLSLGFHTNEADASGNTTCGKLTDTICCVPMAPTPSYETPRPGVAGPNTQKTPDIPPGYAPLNPYSTATNLFDENDFITGYGPGSLNTKAPSRTLPPKKTAQSCPGPKEYTVRGKTYYVQSPSTRAQNAKKQLEYVMDRPVGTCDTKPTNMKEGFLSLSPSSIMKGTQQEFNSKKLADLRGMNY
jgi:hypothetical protein